MSSAPTGIDSREYAYKAHCFTALGNVFVPGWLVTKIQIFCTNGSVALRLTEGEIPIVAGGCVCLEPNGAMRTALGVAGTAPGDTFLGIVEFWYPVQPTGISPSP